MKTYYVFFIIFALVLTPLACAIAQSSDYGDVNDDGSISVSDVVYLINYLFKGGSAPNPTFIGDCNGDDNVSVSDVVYLINYLFKGGPRPQNFYLPPDSSEIVYDAATGGYLVPNRIIVQFEDTTNLSIVNQLLSSINGQPVGEIRRLRTYEWEVTDTNFAFQILRAHTAVVFAVPNYYTSFCVTKPSDPAFIGLQQHAFNLIRAPLAWDLGVGSNSVAMGIVDIGINPEHPDLQNRLTYRFGCTWSAGVNDHGTLVSGVAAAEVNNLIGIAGVTWANPIIVWGIGAFKEIKIGPLSFTVADPFGIGQGVEFINKYARNTLNKKLVINISTGLFEDAPRFIQDLFGAPMEAAIAAAYNDGCLIVSAAGNAGIEITKGGVFQGSGKRSYPASFWQVLAVGSVNLLDQRASYSDYGAEVIAAPGSLYSTSATGGWRWAQGTSLSAPMVAGIAALIWSSHPELSNSDLISILTVTADPSGAFGLGRANAWRAIKWADGDPVGPNKLPGEPTWKTPGGIPGDSKVTLQWNPPTSNYDGTSPMDDNIAGYHIYKKLSSGSEDSWAQITPINAPWPSTQYVDEGLSNDVSYDYRITSVDQGGQEGYFSLLLTVTPQQPPVTLKYQFDGSESGEQFGRSVSGNGDVNSDGVPDIAVGAPGATISGRAGTGKTYIYSGVTGSRILTFLGDIEPGGGMSKFGTSVAIIGDVNGDGRADILVGEPGLGRSGLPYQNGVGMAYIYSGLSGNRIRSIDPTSLGQGQGSFGSWVAGGKDVNGDGVNDFAIIGGGKAFVFSGTDNSLLFTFDQASRVGFLDDIDSDNRPEIFILSGSVRIYSGASGTLLYTLSDDQFYSSSGSVDLNNDNKPEIVCGAPLSTSQPYGYVHGGRVYIYSGATGNLIQILEGISENDYYGTEVLGAGDIDGDGDGDVVTSGRNPYRADVYSGSPLSISYTIYNYISSAVSLASLGDINGDARDDFAISNYTTAPGGSVYVYASVVAISTKKLKISSQ